MISRRFSGFSLMFAVWSIPDLISRTCTPPYPSERFNQPGGVAGVSNSIEPGCNFQTLLQVLHSYCFFRSAIVESGLQTPAIAAWYWPQNNAVFSSKMAGETATYVQIVASRRRLKVVVAVYGGL